MLQTLFKSRYSLLLNFIIGFLLLSFSLRTTFYFLCLTKIDISLLSFIKIFSLGSLYDLSVALGITLIYNIYLLILPDKWVKTKVNSIITKAWLFITLLITLLSFFAEITFWQEFESRFNFIAVDYLIYTYEVVNNINESYPLPILLGSIIILIILIYYFFKSKKVFLYTYKKGLNFGKRIAVSGTLLTFTITLFFFLRNSDADISSNRYENEITKAGIFSFFSAFKNNELNFNDFYYKIPTEKAFNIIRKELNEENTTFYPKKNSIKRAIKNGTNSNKPNIIMITVESLSADFLKHFGNKQQLTPMLDSLADCGLLFTNMYATGTRTVRGMEALSLSIPPTPGSSIVRRSNNKNLTTIGSIFQKAGYSTAFFYGGDGYFDNMNEYFGGNGFDIIDRGRSVTIGDSYKTKRTIIEDKNVSFENAWGICDEDLYNVVIKNADDAYSQKKHFYDFVMTTSNHRPYTFPINKIKAPTGTREAAIQYTDYALGKFIEKAKTKNWYKNTIIIIVADHCASSAGKNEIEVSKYHIPCIILNIPKYKKKTINKLCSQIDLYPTLFSLIGWSYESNLYGKNIFDKNFTPRAYLGTYQKLAYLENDSLVVLGPQQKVETYLYNSKTNQQIPYQVSRILIEKSVASYQTAYNLFKNGGLNL